jgi:hypothetical protein
LARKGITVKTLKLLPAGPEFTATSPDGPRTYKETPWFLLLQQVIDDSPTDPQGRPMGFGPELMEARLRLRRVVKRLDENSTEVSFEDADTLVLAEAAAGSKWMRLSEWTNDFLKALKELPTQPSDEDKEDEEEEEDEPEEPQAGKTSENGKPKQTRKPGKARAS